MTRIFWDTNLFIYLVEPNGTLTTKTVELLRRLDQGKMELMTSVITSAELQTGPLKTGNRSKANDYKVRLQKTARLLPFGMEEADRYAEIRQLASVRGADAVQLACASVAGSELFVTNDLRLLKFRIPGIHFIVTIETALQLISP